LNKIESIVLKKACYHRRISNLTVGAAKCLHFRVLHHGRQNSWHR